MKNIIFSSFRDRKKYLIYIFLIIPCFIILLILFTVHKYYDYYINDIVGNKIQNKIIYIDKFDQNNNIIDKNMLEETNNIDFIYKKFKDINLLYESNNLMLDFDYYDKINILLGGKPTNNFEIIIPNYLKEKLNIKNEEDFISIDMKINDKVYTFKIVGVYDNNYEIIYTSYDTLENINKDMEIPFNNYLGIVTEYRYLDNTISNIQNIFNCNASIADYSNSQEIDSLTKIKNSIQMCLIIISIFIFIIFYSILKNIYTNEEKNIALLKALGYKNSINSLIILIRILVILALSFILTIIIYFLSIFIIKSCIADLNIINFLNSFNVEEIFPPFIIIIILIILILLISYNKKYKKINILQILSDN